VKTLLPYKDGTPLVWVQDEPWNMGAWYRLNARLPRCSNAASRSRVSRAEARQPRVTGSHA
jgi:2-oxoglutarate dehydrogenase E1 component